MNKNKFFIVLIVFILASLTLSVTYFNNTNEKDNINEYPKVSKENVIDGQVETKQEIIDNRVVSANILAAGDVMFHMPQIKGAYNAESGTYNFKESFSHVKNIVEKADLALVNYETVAAGSDRGFQGYPNFNSPIETIEALSYTGFDILSTANNHCLDQGKSGVISTIEAIKDHGLKNIGTYVGLENNKILIEEVKDIKIGLLSYTYGCNGMEFSISENELNSMVNIIDEERIKNDIEKTVDMGSDLVVVFIHWGNEYQREPSESQLELGKRMVEWGANIIFGSHPHVIQRTEVINHNGKDNFIIYSLGNFLSNQRRETINNKYTEDGIMVTVNIEKDFAKNETIIKGIQYIPTWVYKYSYNGLAKYEIIPLEETKLGEIDPKIKSRAVESYENTMSIIGQ